MDTINSELTDLLQQIGVHQESMGLTQRIIIIAGIITVSYTHLDVYKRQVKG